MAIAYQTIGSGTMANAGTTCNYSVNTITANANGLLLLCIGNYDGSAPTPTSTTGGETPTAIGNAGDIGHQYGWLRYDQEATLSTSYAITNTFSTGQDEGAASATLVYDGVDQTTVTRASNISIFNAGASHVRTLASITVGDMCTALVSDFNDNTHTESNCTERCDIINASGDTAVFTGNLTADGTTEILGATAGTGPGTAGAVALIPAAAAAGAARIGNLTAIGAGR